MGLWDVVFEVALAVNPAPGREYKKKESKRCEKVCEWEASYKKVANGEGEQPDPIEEGRIVMGNIQP